MASLIKSSDPCKTSNAKLFEFGGFDMQWSYYTNAGRKAASCSACGVQARSWQRPFKARIKKLPYDFNDTDDDKVILSARAKEHLETCWPGHIKLRQVFENAWEAEPKRVLFIKNPEEVIYFSSEFGSGDGKACPDCGLCYCQTFKGNLYQFQNPELIEEDGIFRTDVSFGSGFRGPLWLAGPKAAFALSARFREVWLRAFEKRNDGSWEYRFNDPFRVPSKPDVTEPTYPNFLE